MSDIEREIEGMERTLISMADKIDAEIAKIKREIFWDDVKSVAIVVGMGLTAVILAWVMR